MEKLTKSEARELVVVAQALAAQARFPADANGVAAAIRHLGYVQIDTISVIERAHHHTLWARVPGYEPRLLGEAIASRKVFEYWSHAAAYLPIEDFRFCWPRMQRYREGKIHFGQDVDAKTKRHVLNRIAAEGPLQSKDFADTSGRGKQSWFEWKPAKVALERLFMEGRLMVPARKGFQKVYDLTERVLPKHVNQEPPTDAEFADYLIFGSLPSLGLANAAEIAYNRGKAGRDLVAARLEELVESGKLRALDVKGVGKFFALPAALEQRNPEERAVHILSPFDNLVIQRGRLERFFDFDYQIECYVPEPKRKFGYFTLPILEGTKFIGRMDAKAERAEKRLLVKNIWFEKEVAPKKSLREKIRAATLEFAHFNGCGWVKWDGVHGFRRL